MAAPIYITQISYKPNNTGGFAAITKPPYVTVSYGTCLYGGDAHIACQYGSDDGGAAGDGNRWYVSVWTNARIN